MDTDKMPFGKHQEKRMSEVPLSYWRWYIDQDWAPQWKAVWQYAHNRLREYMPKNEPSPANGLSATPDGRLVNAEGRTVGFACGRRP